MHPSITGRWSSTGGTSLGKARHHRKPSVGLGHKATPGRHATRREEEGHPQGARRRGLSRQRPAPLGSKTETHTRPVTPPATYRPHTLHTLPKTPALLAANALHMALPPLGTLRTPNALSPPTDYQLAKAGHPFGQDFYLCLQQTSELKILSICTASKQSD